MPGVVDFVREVLSTHGVQGLLDCAGRREHDWLELKRGLMLEPGDRDHPEMYRWKLAQELTALANTRGGVLVLGIDDRTWQSVVSAESGLHAGSSPSDLVREWLQCGEWDILDRDCDVGRVGKWVLPGWEAVHGAVVDYWKEIIGTNAVLAVVVAALEHPVPARRVISDKGRPEHQCEVYWHRARTTKPAGVQEVTLTDASDFLKSRERWWDQRFTEQHQLRRYLQPLASMPAAPPLTEVTIAPLLPAFEKLVEWMAKRGPRLLTAAPRRPPLLRAVLQHMTLRRDLLAGTPAYVAIRSSEDVARLRVLLGQGVLAIVDALDLEPLSDVLVETLEKLEGRLHFLARTVADANVDATWDREFSEFVGSLAKDKRVPFCFTLRALEEHASVFAHPSRSVQKRLHLMASPDDSVLNLAFNERERRVAPVNPIDAVRRTGGLVVAANAETDLIGRGALQWDELVTQLVP